MMEPSRRVPQNVHISSLSRPMQIYLLIMRRIIRYAFPPTYMSFYLSPRQLDYAASVWAVLDRFGYKELLKELNGTKIHRLENILTLSLEVHELFDTLKLWFEPATVPSSTVTASGEHEILVVSVDSESESLLILALTGSLGTSTQHLQCRYG
jgi:hypothetical protein